MFGAPTDQYPWNGKQPAPASSGLPPTSTPSSVPHPNDYQGSPMNYNKKMQGAFFSEYYGTKENALSQTHDLSFAQSNPGPPPRNSYHQDPSSNSRAVSQAPATDFFGSNGKPPPPSSDFGYAVTNPNPPSQQNPYSNANLSTSSRGNVVQYQDKYQDQYQEQYQDQLQDWNEWNDEPFVPVTFDQLPPTFTSTVAPPQVSASDQPPLPLPSETTTSTRGASSDVISGYQRFPNQGGGLHTFNNNINQDWKWQSPHNLPSPANHSHINNNQPLSYQPQLNQQQNQQQLQQHSQFHPQNQPQQNQVQQQQSQLQQQEYQQEAATVENINNILTDLNINSDQTLEASQYWSDVDTNLVVETGDSGNEWQPKEPTPSSLERHVTGQTLAPVEDDDGSNERGDGAEDEGPQPNDQRMVPGQLSDEEVSNTNSGERMVTGQTSDDNERMYIAGSDLQSNERLRARWNETSLSQERLVAGESAVGSDNSVRNQFHSAVTAVSMQSNNSRLIPGQGNSCDNSSNVDLDFASDTRMIPGHRDDTDPSTSGPSSIAVSRAGSEQRMVPGQVTADDGDNRMRLPNSLNDNSALNTTVETPRPALDSESGFERTTPAGRNTIEENSNPLPGFQRMVVGQMHQDSSLSLSQADHSHASDGANVDLMESNELPPPGLHRMVVGEIRGESTPGSAAKETDKASDERNDWDRRRSDREPRNVDDSGSEYRKRDKSDKKWSNEKSRHRRRRETDDYSDYSSPERNYRRSRDDIYRPRRDERFHKKREDRDHKETPYEPSQDESGSDREGDRKYPDGRRRRRHRRHSPEPYYDYYHDDPRHYPGHNRHSRHYEYDDRYYKNRSRPSSRTESDYRNRMYGMYDPRAPKSFYGPEYTGPPSIPMDRQYLLHLRETDPRKYAQWYTQVYMASQFASSAAEQSHPTDRSSVHSGRSSANNGQLKTNMRKNNLPFLSRRESKNPLLHSHLFQGPDYYSPPVAPMSLHMREMGPKKYAEWCSQCKIYIVSQFESNIAKQFGPTKLSRVDVSRNSANNGQFKTSSRTFESCPLDDDMSKTEDIASPRNTPAKFSTAHIKGIINNRGNLLVINPCYPFDNQPATIDEYPLQPNVCNDQDLVSFLQCPGPFVVGQTHKNTVLQYLRSHTEKPSSSAEYLLYSLIQLVIKLNGVILGTDIAELLIENYHSSVGSAEFDRLDKYRETQETNKLSQAEVTKKFRELLLQGNKTEALDWAMTNNEWGHALLLASKMDARTYNNALANFANGLPASDPLQTLYQLMSGREPQAVTCCADRRWGDWRPHLAMILSNPSSRPEVDRKAIVTLGDSLCARGSLFAAHFCYLTAQLDFSTYSKPGAKYVLLGSSHSLPFSQFASNSAIMLTLCYEYAKKLHNKNFVIPSLQPYKYLLATRLVDWSRPNIALQYLEQVAIEIIRDPNLHGHQLAMHTLELSEKIKYSDLSLSLGGDVCDDPDWLVDLRRLVDDAMDGNFRLSERGSTSNLTISDPPEQETASHSQISSQHQNLPSTNSTQDPYYADGGQQPVKQDETKPGFWQPPPSKSYYEAPNSGYDTTAPQIDTAEHPTQEFTQHQWNSSNLNAGQTDYSQWATGVPNQWGTVPEVETNQQVPSQPTEASWGAQSLNTDYNNSIPASNSQPSSFDYYPQPKENNQMPNSLPPMPDYGNRSEVPNKMKTNSQDTPAKKSEKKNKDASSNGGGGWFGGLWDKLARPKNQMKLPDDSNPQIVWDNEKKRWVNKNSDGDEVEAEFKPPPKAADLSFHPSATSSPSSTASLDNSTINNTINNTQLASLPPPSGNKYKLQRGRGMRSNYVDIMNPSSNKPAQPAQPMFPLPTAQAAPVNNFFIPAPIENNENLPTDFISPSGYVGPAPSSDQPAELSRCSSASSLSREVSFYMSRPHRQ